MPKFSQLIPEVKKPERKLGFNDKLKWTLLILLAYFALSQIALYGLAPERRDYFETVRAIIAGKFGSLLTLGIGPIVTAGIILQLMVGVKLLPLDLNTPEGKVKFQNYEKILVLAVTVFESLVYVFMGGLPALNDSLYLRIFLVAQLILGTYIIVLLDDMSQKWGFMSGISLFIAAGVSETIIIASLNPFPNPQGPGPAGKIPQAIYYALNGGAFRDIIGPLIPVMFTVLVFLIVVYVQSINVEIPLSFGRVGGFITRWPLNLFYTGNIPVILVGALLANIQLMGELAKSKGWSFFGGILYFTRAPNMLMYNLLLNPLIFFRNVGSQIAFLASNPSMLLQIDTMAPDFGMLIQAVTFTIIMVGGSILFAMFWVKTANQDSKSVAKQINQAGMFRQGFRSDPRILETILDRYIPQLTIIGGAAVGLLAAFADFTDALGGGTGILLTVMIVYRLYATIVREHMVEMNPMVRKFVER